jgi:DNA-directed RNA polymerase subunit M/transcription elongation factor TFIIS
MDSIIFVPLEPISTSLRSQWIQKLSDSLKKRNIVNFEIQARKLEHYCNLTRQARIKLDEDVGAFKYGGDILLEFDSPQNHAAAAIFSYSSSIERAFWICESVSDQTLKDGLVDIAGLLAEKDEDLCENTDHAQWETGFYQRQNEAKAFLKVGKDEIKTSGLFSCVACKSFDVDVEQKQCRSSDEGMDVFISCNRCGKRSRIRG